MKIDFWVIAGFISGIILPIPTNIAWILAIGGGIIYLWVKSTEIPADKMRELEMEFGDK